MALPFNGTVLGRRHDRRGRRSGPSSRRPSVWCRWTGRDLARAPKPSLTWLGEVARRQRSGPAEQGDQGIGHDACPPRTPSSQLDQRRFRRRPGWRRGPCRRAAPSASGRPGTSKRWTTSAPRPRRPSPASASRPVRWRCVPGRDRPSGRPAPRGPEVHEHRDRQRSATSASRRRPRRRSRAGAVAGHRSWDSTSRRRDPVALPAVSAGDDVRRRGGPRAHARAPSGRHSTRRSTSWHDGLPNVEVRPLRSRRTGRVAEALGSRSVGDHPASRSAPPGCPPPGRRSPCCRPWPGSPARSRRPRWPATSACPARRPTTCWPS